MVKEIPLTRGYVALVDDEDFEELNKHKWFFNKGYAKRNIQIGNKQKIISMHRIIMSASDNMQVDHKDGKGLNNVRSNLRLCSSIENSRNQRKRTSISSSKFKGVCWLKNGKKWCAYIRINSKQIHLGLFDDEVDAANAYDKAAHELHGEFARTNFG